MSSQTSLGHLLISPRLVLQLQRERLTWLQQGDLECDQVIVLVLGHVQLFVTPWTVAPQAPLSMGIFQARILKWVAMPCSRGIFPTKGLNPGLLHCRWIIYQLSHQGSPRVLGWVVWLLSSGDLSNPGIELGSPALQSVCLPTELPRKP